MTIEISAKSASQLIVQVSAKFSPKLVIPTEEELRLFAKKLLQLDRKIFQDPTIPEKPPFLTMRRELRAPGVAVLKHNPLSLSAETLEFGLIMKLANAPNWGADSTSYGDPNTLNRLAVNVLSEFGTAFPDCSVHRLGKIYTYYFGPFEQNTHEWLREKFLNWPEDVDDYATARLFFLTRRDGCNFNHHIDPVNAPGGGFGLQIKLDVNNQDVTRSISPNRYGSILDSASYYDAEELWNMFVGE